MFNSEVVKNKNRTISKKRVILKIKKNNGIEGAK